jgi:hypothetical protein
LENLLSGERVVRVVRVHPDVVYAREESEQKQQDLISLQRCGEKLSQERLALLCRRG